MLRRRLATRSLALSGLLAGVVAAPALAQIPAPTRCAVGIPSSEVSGYVPLPRGDVCCPLLADPKGQRSFVSYLREINDDDEDREVGSVGSRDAL